MEVIWRNLKSRLRDQLPDHSFKIWVEPLRFAGCQDNTLLLECPNRFCVNWIRDNYLNLFKHELTKENPNLEILLKVAKAARRKQPPPDPQLAMPQVNEPWHWVRRLNPAFTFDRFVTGRSNQFAYSAALSLTQGENGVPNFMYFLSNTGLGKSHLSQAISAEVLARHPRQRVHYLTTEDFVNHMVYSLQHKNMEEFKRRYRRECDIFILEEVHFLSGKERTQGELTYTLDALLNDNKKVVVTSCKLPREIPRLDSGLRSRLNSGLIVSIASPDYATRVRILKQKAKGLGMEVPEEVIHFIAHNIKDDVRQMESSLICMMARSSMAKQPLDLDLAREVVKGFVDHKKRLSWGCIQKYVAESFGIAVEDLKSKSRKQKFAFPRSVAMYFCRKYTDMTLESIGEVFQRNHATVLYALNTLEKKMKRDRKLRSQVEYLSRRMESFFLTESLKRNLSSKQLH